MSVSKTIISITNPDQSTQESTLSTLLAQAPYTLLYFYPKDNTPGCARESRDFSELKTVFEEIGIQIIGVSRDTHESHCSFIQNESLNNILISDPDLILHKEYWAWWEKNNYGKTVTGVIRSTVLLEKTGAILQQRHNVKATGHAQRILTKVEEIVK